MKRADLVVGGVYATRTPDWKPPEKVIVLALGGWAWDRYSRRVRDQSRSKDIAVAVEIQVSGGSWWSPRVLQPARIEGPWDEVTAARAAARARRREIAAAAEARREEERAETERLLARLTALGVTASIVGVRVQMSSPDLAKLLDEIETHRAGGSS